MKKILLNLEIRPNSKKIVLEKIKKYISNPDGFHHIVSLNPENLVIAQKNATFRKVVNTAQIQVIDGFGVVLAGRILGYDLPPRLTGVDLMEEVVRVAAEGSSTVMLVGGKGNLAKELADCYNEQFPKATYVGIEGIKNVAKTTKEENKAIFSIVSSTKPRILLVAFGSPFQELWLWKNRDKLKGIICIGVGGSFDFLSGKIRRAPLFVRRLGLEWIWRLIRQPWRIGRQLRLVEFMYLVLKQRLAMKANSLASK